jgi:hypothetical protein
VDDAISAPGCRDESHPLGFLAGLRGGYLVAPRVGVEVFFGYLRLSERLTRRIHAGHESLPSPLFSDDYQDTTKLAGPVAAVSASYRFLERTPITLRAWLGVGRMRVESSNVGTFVGDVDVGGVPTPIDQSLSIPEKIANVWLPFAGPELRVGYRLGAGFDVDLGIAALLLVPGSAPRIGYWSGRSGDRRLPIPEPGGNGNLGVYKLPDEQALGTALVLVPSVALRYRL